MKLREAIILAGGFGTRLQSVVSDKPKAMAPINGRPFLEYLLDHLINNGIDKFIFSVGYKSEFIIDYFGDSYKNCTINYVLEESPLGTGGAIKFAMNKTHEDHVLVVNGDSLFLANIQEQYQQFINNKAVVSLALKPMLQFDRYGTVLLGKENQILKFEEKKRVENGLINGGVYIFNTKKFLKLPFEQKFSIENDFFQNYVNQFHFVGFKSDAYFLDIGIPTDFATAQEEFKNICL